MRHAHRERGFRRDSAVGLEVHFGLRMIVCNQIPVLRLEM